VFSEISSYYVQPESRTL